MHRNAERGLWDAVVPSKAWSDPRGYISSRVEAQRPKGGEVGAQSPNGGEALAPPGDEAGLWRLDSGRVNGVAGPSSGVMASLNPDDPLPLPFGV